VSANTSGCQPSALVLSTMCAPRRGNDGTRDYSTHDRTGTRQRPCAPPRRPDRCRYPGLCGERSELRTSSQWSIGTAADSTLGPARRCLRLRGERPPGWTKTGPRRPGQSTKSGRSDRETARSPPPVAEMVIGLGLVSKSVLPVTAAPPHGRGGQNIALHNRSIQDDTDRPRATAAPENFSSSESDRPTGLAQARHRLAVSRR